MISTDRSGAEKWECVPRILLFYPVLSGQPVDVDFVVKYLRWRDTWVLISG